MKHRPSAPSRRNVLVMSAATALALVQAGLLSHAAAQPTTRPTDASASTLAPEARTAAAKAALTEALNRSISEGKLLVVTYSNSPTNARENQRSLSAPATRAYLARHAVLFDVTDPGLIRQLTGLEAGGLVDTPGGDPLVFRAGKRLPLNLASREARNPSAKDAAGSIVLALRLDWSVRRPSGAVEHAAFIERYDARDAEPAAKSNTQLAPRALHATNEQGVPPFTPDADALKASGPLGVLADARAQVKAGKLDAAAGMYCWLWERAAQVDPSIEPALVSVVAAEMSLLAKASAPAKARFTALRDEAGSVLRTRDGIALHRYLLLCRVIGEETFNLTFIDDALNDPGAPRAIPAPDRLIAQMLLPACHFNDPVKGVADPGAMIASLTARIDAVEKPRPEQPEPAPAGQPPAPTPAPSPAELAAQAASRAKALAPVVAYAKWLADVELARRYAYALMASPQAGQKVLDRAGVQITPARKAMLASTCKALGVAMP